MRPEPLELNVPCTRRFWRRTNCTFTLGRHHYHTEQFIRNSGSRFVFLRANLYLAVARDEAADSAVSVIADHSHDGMPST